MNVEAHPIYENEFPESFPWEQVNEISLSVIGPRIVEAIEDGWKTKSVGYINGLRDALRIISEVATVT